MNISTEFDYMRGFIGGADFGIGNISFTRLRALWTAFCLHNNLDVDTYTYDRYLAMLWKSLLENGTGGFGLDSFDEFNSHMAEYLI